jgi:CheY-like chemotaxis protein
VSLAAPAAREKGLSLTSAIDPALPPVIRGDAGRIRQVLTNLIGNAVKFTPRGEVAVRVTRARARGREGEVVRFEVADTGSGIPLEAQPLLFQPFTQADGSMTRRYGGSGLGLAICKQLVELLGGAIGFSSQPGHGAAFWFTAPLEEEAAVEVRAPAAAPPRAVARVLLADDGAVDRKVAARLLKALGCDVDAVASGEDAIGRCVEGPYDLVLLDHRLARDGAKVIARIRAALPRRAPIIALTTDREDEARSIEAGMDGCIAKPLRKAELGELLGRWLPARGAA